ncbi:MAG: hypothetical protein GY913_09135 [Proteobacteria bacterium]|nr:hypothetical protein [Pseudomonadota bacterium]MCP4917075.1 hypothetical protein [Pseudomonadota bacterium]
MSKSPIELLESKDIHDRAEAGRQLSRCGVPEDVPRLLDVAFEDPSPGARLYAVGAAADILSRYRVGPAAATIDEVARRRIFEGFKGIDPEVNAGMFSVLATLGIPRSARRILVGVQDPRLDVRTGALVGLYRYFVSSAAVNDEPIRQKTLELLNSPRLRPDAMAWIVRLAANCGWQDAVPALEALTSRADQVAEAATQALARLETARDPDAIEGLWKSYGTDGGEVPAVQKPWTWLVLQDGIGLEVGIDRIRAFRYTCDDPNRLEVQGDDAWPMRRMVLDEPTSRDWVEAIQVGSNTWFRAADSDLVTATEYFLERAGGLSEPWRRLVADQLIPRLPTNANGVRVIARVELAAGYVDRARDRLQAICEKKSAPADAWFYLGEVHAAEGEMEFARKAWSNVLEKATKRNPLRTLAEERLA